MSILNDYQDDFNLTIGRLDHTLSKMVMYGHRYGISKEEFSDLIRGDDSANRQTIKHHAEDMILAGRKILKDLGEKEPQ